MKIGVIGVGRTGLAFALLCKKAGYDVFVSDNREDYVFNLNHNICIIDEPWIQKMLFETNGLNATTNNIEVIENADIIFSFVPTPATTEGNFDTSSIFEVSNDFFNASKLDIPIFNKKFVIGSSTNPGDVEQIQNKLSMFSIQVSYNPLCVEKGEVVKGIQESDVVLIGTEYQELANDLVQIYGKIQTTPVNAHIMSSKAVEICKLGIDSFVATKITYANLIGDILKKSNLSNEISSVLKAIGGDSRIGKKNFEYGFGMEGPYLPKNNRSLGYYVNELELNQNFPSIVEEFYSSRLIFLKNLFIQQNPDKSVPFVMNYLSHKPESEILDESQKVKLCLTLLEEGYYFNVIEKDSTLKQLLDLGEQFNGRLKFYKQGTNPEGYLINL